MKARQPLTRERLAELLDYDVETGIFTWKVDRGYTVKAGSVAGYVRQDASLKHYKCVVIKVDRHDYLGHRLAWLWIHGEFPDCDIDHVDGDAANNRAANLRLATRKQNLENSKLQANNSTGYRGVSRNKRTGAYTATVGHNGQKIHLGSFANVLDAAEAARAARHKLFTHYHERDQLK